MTDDESTAGRRTITITPEFIAMAVKQADNGLDVPDDAELIDLQREDRHWTFVGLFESEQWDRGNREGEVVPAIGAYDDE